VDLAGSGTSLTINDLRKTYVAEGGGVIRNAGCELLNQLGPQLQIHAITVASLHISNSLTNHRSVISDMTAAATTTTPI